MGNTTRVDFFHMYYHLSRWLSFFELFLNEKRYISSCCSFIVEPNAGLKRHHSDSEETPEDATPLRNRVSFFAGFLHFALAVKNCFFDGCVVSRYPNFCFFSFCLYGQTGRSASKKRKTSPGASKNGGNEEESSTQPGRAFVPFNYSDVDYSTFTGKKVQLENSLTYMTRIPHVYKFTNANGAV